MVVSCDDLGKRRLDKALDGDLPATFSERRHNRIYGMDFNNNASSVSALPDLGMIGRLVRYKVPQILNMCWKTGGGVQR